MKYNEAITKILDDQKIGKATLAARVGLSRQTIGTQLSGKNDLGIAKVVAYLAELNYEVAFVPKSSRLPKGSYLIDGVPEKEGE